MKVVQKGVRVRKFPVCGMRFLCLGLGPASHTMGIKPGTIRASAQQCSTRSLQKVLLGDRWHPQHRPLVSSPLAHAALGTRSPHAAGCHARGTRAPCQSHQQHRRCQSCAGARPAPSRSGPWTGNFGCTRAEAGTASTLSAPLKPQTCNTHPIEAPGKTNHSTPKPICTYGTAPCPGRDPGVQRGHHLPWVTACPCPHPFQSTGSRSRGLRPRQSCRGLGKGPVPHGCCWKCRFTPGLSPHQSRTPR